MRCQRTVECRRRTKSKVISVVAGEISDRRNPGLELIAGVGSWVERRDENSNSARTLARNNLRVSGTNEIAALIDVNDAQSNRGGGEQRVAARVGHLEVITGSH